MKLLWCTSYLPYPPDGGGKLRSYHLLTRLATHHEVHLLTVIEPADRNRSYAPLTQRCASVTPIYISEEKAILQRTSEILSHLPQSVARVTTPDGMKQLEQLLAQHTFDAAIVDQIHFGEYFPQLHKAYVPIFLICHTVEKELWQGFAKYRSSLKSRQRAQLEVAKLSQYEPHILRSATYRAAVSDVDRVKLENISKLRCGVSPNGVDLDFFFPRVPPAHTSDAPWRLVMTGTMGYPPNIDAVQYFLDAIFPQLQRLHARVEVTFVGSSPPDALLALQDDNGLIRFTGFVEDVRPYVDAADVFIVPLRVGGGTRLKILEAMARGIPVISTSIGAEGLEVTHQQDIWLADTSEAFCEGVQAIITHPQSATAMTTNARALVERKYGWDSIAHRLESDLYAMIGESEETKKRPSHR